MQTHGIVRKSHTAITRRQENKQSKVTSSIFPIEMIAKLECSSNNTQENIEQLQNPTMGVTINNESTTTKRTAAKASEIYNTVIVTLKSSPKCWDATD